MLNESFAVVNRSSGEIVALWASQCSKPRKVGSERLYSLDRFEVSHRFRPPKAIRREFSAFCLALVASRAVEHRATGLLVDSLTTDKVRLFYQGMGLTERSLNGWTPKEGLSTFHGDAAWLKRFQEIAYDVID